MKNNCKILCLGFVASLGFLSTYGQTTIDAEFRPRTELRSGFRKPLAKTTEPMLATYQRTRLNADYKGKILYARLSLQDARIWGNSDTKTNASKVEINEAWFEYLITSGISLQMGRQALNYDDKRIFSSPVWSNTGTSHDVMVAKYNSPFVVAHGGFAYNNSKDTLLNSGYSYTSKQNYKSMAYIWLSKELYKGLNLSLIGVTDAFEKKTNPQIIYARYTYGGNLVFANDSSALAFTITAYKQNGIDPNKALGSKYASLNSFFLAGKLSYRITDFLMPGVGVDYYSGSAANIDASKSTSFTRLYGAAHNFNGYMEYFQTLPTQGLIDYYGSINSKITKSFSAEIAAHAFYFDYNFFYNKVKTDKNLGSEIDITLKYNVSREIALQGGYSMYFNSGVTAKYFKMQGVDLRLPQWAYIMFTIKPQFYKTPEVKAN